MIARSFDHVAHARAMREGGFWIDRTFDESLVEAIAAAPDKPAVIGYRADRPVAARLSYAELGDRVARAAGALRRLGVGRGDVVAVQLPNWPEFVVLALAVGRLGAVFNPLMPIFRERELGYMLGFAEARVLVVPKACRGFDHEVMAAGMRAHLPALEQVIVVDGAGSDSFDRLLLGGTDRIEAPVHGAERALDPGDPSVLMFTSGTTGSPKGALHSSNTLVACADSLAGRLRLGPDDVLLACSPVGHMAGYAAGVTLGLRLGATIVLQDVWQAERGVRIMDDEGVTYTAGSTPFLADICDAVAAGAPRPRRLRSFLCSGAPIPPVLIERAARQLDLQVCSLWGMTESLASTLTEPERAAVKSSTTDGRPLDGVEVRVVDLDGRPLPPGETGQLMVRGAQMFSGYYRRPELPTFDAEGWFDTGDLAYLDAEGYIRINGRTKDVLIRGGENVPVVEIEGVLHQHAAVTAASIVGYPDDRLGERACAFVVLRPGRTFELANLRAWMAECKVAKQYWPERLVVVAELPRTPSGKVQKFRLRELAAEPARSLAATS